MKSRKLLCLDEIIFLVFLRSSIFDLPPSVLPSCLLPRKGTETEQKDGRGKIEEGRKCEEMKKIQNYNNNQELNPLFSFFIP
jgi:hypothetical protein